MKKIINDANTKMTEIGNNLTKILNKASDFTDMLKWELQTNVKQMKK